ncbi:hypothetical protein RM780_07095 [Streptomyces sp. DSM 44917]|uniref:Uncharacterized protein n=1 Tax=Streptomyces boetiae TaxID=3075541 RepID=A0ABU2L5T7_9ACTN|nr:hypothetical protein [Streptomyces sp. DSM 44917]MDT0306727.1 hypothetical protein [Streptomyces sp. DSM 44917]
MTESTKTSPDETPADGPSAPPAVSGREVKRLTRRVRSFAAAHGGAEGQIAYLGIRGHRLVLVGTDGAWGDVVSPHRAALEGAAEAAGVTLRETFDGEMAARVRTGPYEWTRMAGIQLGGPSNTSPAAA